MIDVQVGPEIMRGKTKVIFEAIGRPQLAVIQAMDDVTAFDDPSATETMDQKSLFSTTTTCRVFELLERAGVPTAYRGQVSATEFLADRCKMIALEVIIRRYAVGSYLKRMPHLREDGPVPRRFDPLVFELFLKTKSGSVTDLQGGVHEVIWRDPASGRLVDDPWIQIPYLDPWAVAHPKLPLSPSNPVLMDHHIPQAAILPPGVTVGMIEELAREAFLEIERAFDVLGYRLVDYKIEFGMTADGRLVIADVIDNDSWRLRTESWEEISKQAFRDGATMQDVFDKYQHVADLVGRFA